MTTHLRTQSMASRRSRLFARTVAILFCVALLTPPGMPEASASSAPLFGAWAPSSPWEGMGAVQELETAVERRLDIVHFYETWERSYDHDWVFDHATSDGRAVMLSLEPWSPGGSPEQPKWALSTFLRGDHDARIRDWARGLRDRGHVVYLRPMHEMNGDWYPWSGVRNGNTAADYVAAWRHIHKLFQETGATNVRWVWAPNVLDVPQSNDLERYYPGGQYVDVLGLDGYNWGTSQPGYGGWLSFEQIYAEAYARVTALGPQPVWLTEVASDETGGDKAQWVRDMFAALKTRYPRVAAVVWFNERKERDWRVTSSPASTAAFVEALAPTEPAPEREPTEPAPSDPAAPPEGSEPAPDEPTAAPRPGKSTTAPGPKETRVKRFAGRDRIHTAQLVAEHAFAPQVETAVIARADDHADALAGAALAGALDGPVLLTARGQLSKETAAALSSLQVRNVVVLGGPGAIAPAVVDELGSLLGADRVTRISGRDRFSTAAAAAAAVGTPGELSSDGPTALLANGASFPDALAAGPVAWQLRIPLLLTTADRLPLVTQTALHRAGVRHVVVMGGPVVVTDTVLEELRRDGFTVERVSGPNRTATAVAMANLAVERLGWTGSSVALARGDAFADALAMGPLAGATSSPLLLTTSPRQVGRDANAWLARRGCALDVLLVGGGSSAMSPEAEETAKAEAQSASC